MRTVNAPNAAEGSSLFSEKALPMLAGSSTRLTREDSEKRAREESDRRLARTLDKEYRKKISGVAAASDAASAARDDEVVITVTSSPIPSPDGHRSPHFDRR